MVRQVRSNRPDRFVYGDAFFEVEYQLDALIHAYPKPFITWAHGVDMGGGVGLSVAGSERIVSEGLKMAMPAIAIRFNGMPSPKPIMSAAEIPKSPVNNIVETRGISAKGIA